ncbi:hypothetical protein [Rhodopila globiformis]|uniref:hypothetical protein n=1 Tax=Rhodopila globiformis TaxID=1071 RepID=UPI0011B061D4|nr:hypothetical protein [Rhodopila globiformis]
MKAIFALTLGTAMVLSSAALAQSNPARETAPTASESLMAPYTAPPPIAGAPRPLFNIGQLPVGVWAPVQPPYDSRANRTGAANPVWWDDNAF